jgi:hypothetical protein
LHLLFSTSGVQFVYLFLADAIISENFVDKLDDYDFPAIVAQALRIMKIYPNSNPIENENNNANPDARSRVSFAAKSNAEFNDDEIVAPFFATLSRLIRFAYQFNKARTEGKKAFVSQVKRTELIPMAIHLLKSRAEATVARALEFLCMYIDATEESKWILNCEELVSVLEAYALFKLQHGVKHEFPEFLPRIFYQAASCDIVKSALLKVECNVAVSFLLRAHGSRLFPRIFLKVVEGFLRECPGEVAESFFEQGVLQN